MRLPPLPSIKEILRLYKIRALKQLSQNFLLNRQITDKFVRCAGRLTDHHVVEVGPGPGSITRSILESGIKHLTVVEKDSRFMETLNFLKEASTVPMDVVHGDILKYDMTQNLSAELKREWEDGPPPLHIMGNLPFSVSTPLIIKWLRQVSLREGVWSYGRVKMTLTFQYEVGQRMVAKVGHEQRSRLSIMSMYLCDVRMPMVIPGHSFLPKPDVDVAVVTLEPRAEPLIKSVPFEYVEKAVSLIFHHRNKNFKNCVHPFFPPHRPELIEELGNRSGIETHTVPRMLTIKQFEQLCQVYYEICRREDGLFEYDYRASKSLKNWRKRTTIWKEHYGDDYYYYDDDSENDANLENLEEGSMGKLRT